jgi:hypothetical protein
MAGLAAAFNGLRTIMDRRSILCSTSQAAQLGHSKRCPQVRHSVSGA